VEREPLDWWLDRINLLIDMTGDIDLGGAVVLDYSAASLSALEAAVREWLADPAEALYDEQQSFTAGAVAYLGEALMRVGGGRWDWAAERPPTPRSASPCWCSGCPSIGGASTARANLARAAFRSFAPTRLPGWGCSSSAASVGDRRCRVLGRL
jgi:hypothetical protein